MECSQCHKIFTRKDNLKRHMKIHDHSEIEPMTFETNFQKNYGEEDRLDTMEVVIDELEDMITEVENEMKVKFEQLKQKIMDYMFECHEVAEKEIIGDFQMEGGSLSDTESLRGQYTLHSTSTETIIPRQIIHIEQNDKHQS